MINFRGCLKSETASFLYHSLCVFQRETTAFSEKQQKPD